MILISHVSRCILNYLNFYISYTKLNCCTFQFVCINSCLFQNQNCIIYLEIGVYIGPLLSILSRYLVSYLSSYQKLSIIYLLLLRSNKLLCCNYFKSVCFTIGCVSISKYLCQTHIHLILPHRVHIIAFILLLNNVNAILNNVAHYKFISVLVDIYIILNHYGRG